MSELNQVISPHFSPYFSVESDLELASQKVGGKVLSCSDDFFASMENLILPTAAVFIADKYTENGKWMDGWESRRKRNVGAGNDHDWCILRLGLPGRIKGFDVDTSYFVGNFPEAVSIEGMELGGQLEDRDALEKGSLKSGQWTPLLPKSRVLGGRSNWFPAEAASRMTHLRLKIFPDGGVARLRVYGEVIPNWESLKDSKGWIDTAAAASGGSVISCSDMFFGKKDHLILPGRAATMGEGWETKRRRGPGFDWIVVRLSATTQIREIEVDTNHFKGNFPESCRIEGCRLPERNLDFSDLRDRTDLLWKEVLPRTPLRAHEQRRFGSELKCSDESFDYVRLSIFPDGGVSRLRVLGLPQI